MNLSMIKKHNNSKMLIESVWVLEKNSGICIFEQNYGMIKNEKISIDLICGFLSAISLLAVEVFDESINYIELSKRKIYFKNTTNFVFIFSILNKGRLNTKKIINLINSTSDEFNTQFNSDFENWDRNVYHFEPFSEHLNSILGN